MKLSITEKQYKSILTSVVSEQDDFGDPQPKSGESEEKSVSQGYPTVSTWEEVVGSTTSRGPSNQIKNTKWSDVVGSTITRGTANMLSEQWQSQGFGSSAQMIKPKDWTKGDLDKIQSAADIAGIVPVIGDGIDAINALVYFGRSINDGKFMPNGLNGLLSVLGIIPVVGSAMSIPLKTLFKSIPTDVAGKIIKSFSTGQMTKSVKTLKIWALKSDTGRKAFDSLVTLAIRHQDDIHSITGAAEKLTNIIQKIIPFKVDDVLFKLTIRPILKNINQFFDVLVNLGKSTVKSLLKIRKIPGNRLSQYGRLAYEGFGLNIKKAGGKRMFYASQDMYMAFLKKDGTGQLLKGNAVMKQAAENLGLRAINKTDDLATYAYRNGIPEDKIMREYTNLAILNHPKGFEKWLKTADAQTRFNRFIKTITDPTVVFDATETFGAMKKAGFKYLLVKGKETTRKYYPTTNVVKNSVAAGAAAGTAKAVAKPNQIGTTKTTKTTKPITTTQPKSANGFPLKVGDRHAIIGYVQRCLKIPVTKTFDSTTKSAIIKAGYDLSKGLTWKLYNKILAHCKK